MGDAGLSDALQGIISGTTDAVDGFNNLPEPVKDTILGFSNLFLTVKTVEVAMKTFGIQAPFALKAVTNGMDGLKIATLSLSSGMKKAAAGTKAFLAANAPLLILSASVGVLVAVTNAVKKYKEEQEKVIEVLNQQKDVSKNVDDLLVSYKELASQTSLTAKEEQNLIEIKQKLIDLLPESEYALENENLSLQEQYEIVTKLNETELENMRINAQKTT